VPHPRLRPRPHRPGGAGGGDEPADRLGRRHRHPPLHEPGAGDRQARRGGRAHGRLQPRGDTLRTDRRHAPLQPGGPARLPGAGGHTHLRATAPLAHPPLVPGGPGGHPAQGAGEGEAEPLSHRTGAGGGPGGLPRRPARRRAAGHPHLPAQEVPLAQQARHIPRTGRRVHAAAGGRGARRPLLGSHPQDQGARLATGAEGRRPAKHGCLRAQTGRGGQLGAGLLQRLARRALVARRPPGQGPHRSRAPKRRRARGPPRPTFKRRRGPRRRASPRTAGASCERPSSSAASTPAGHTWRR